MPRQLDLITKVPSAISAISGSPFKHDRFHNLKGDVASK